MRRADSGSAGTGILNAFGRRSRSSVAKPARARLRTPYNVGSPGKAGMGLSLILSPRSQPRSAAKPQFDPSGPSELAGTRRNAGKGHPGRDSGLGLNGYFQSADFRMFHPSIMASPALLSLRLLYMRLRGTLNAPFFYCSVVSGVQFPCSTVEGYFQCTPNFVLDG